MACPRGQKVAFQNPSETGASLIVQRQNKKAELPNRFVVSHENAGGCGILVACLVNAPTFSSLLPIGGGDCLSLLGHRVQTPNLDALAAEGTLFERHFANAVPCGPSRASLHTGMYLQNHRSGTNGTPLDHRFDNWALQLRSIGYTPSLFGYTDTALDPRFVGHRSKTEDLRGAFAWHRTDRRDGHFPRRMGRLATGKRLCHPRAQLAAVYRKARCSRIRGRRTLCRPLAILRNTTIQPSWWIRCLSM